MVEKKQEKSYRILCKRQKGAWFTFGIFGEKDTKNLENDLKREKTAGKIADYKIEETRERETGIVRIIPKDSFDNPVVVGNIVEKASKRSLTETTENQLASEAAKSIGVTSQQAKVIRPILQATYSLIRGKISDDIIRKRIKDIMPNASQFEIEGNLPLVRAGVEKLKEQIRRHRQFEENIPERELTPKNLKELAKPENIDLLRVSPGLRKRIGEAIQRGLPSAEDIGKAIQRGLPSAEEYKRALNEVLGQAEEAKKEKPTKLKEFSLSKKQKAAVQEIIAEQAEKPIITTPSILKELKPYTPDFSSEQRADLADVILGLAAEKRLSTAKRLPIEPKAEPPKKPPRPPAPKKRIPPEKGPSSEYIKERVLQGENIYKVLEDYPGIPEDQENSLIKWYEIEYEKAPRKARGKKAPGKPKKGERKKKKGTPKERAKFIKKLRAQGQNTNYILEQLQQEYNINQRQVNAYQVNIKRGTYNPPKEKARKKRPKPSKKPRAKNAPEEKLPKPLPVIPEEKTKAEIRKAKTEIFPKPQKEPAKEIDYDLVLHLFGNLKRKKPEETYEKLEAEVAERFKLNPEEVEKFRKEYADAAKNLFKKIEEAEKAKREKEKIKPVEKQLVDKRAVEAAIDWVNHYREKGLTSEQIKDEIIQKHLELGWTHENAEKIYRLANKNAPRRRPTEKLKAIEQKVVKEPKSWVETYYPTFTSISRGTIRGVDYLAREAIKGADYLAREAIKGADYLAREAIKGADYLAKKTVQPIKKTVSMIRGERERQAKAKQAGIERPIAGWYKKEIKPQLKNLVEREWKEGLPRAKKVAKAGVKGVKGFGEYIVAPAAKAVGKVVKDAGKYVIAPAAKLGVKGIKEGWKLGKAALGDLSDRVEQGYTRLEKKLKEIHPYYIIGALILISAVIFSISKPSTTAFIIFTDNNSFNYKILLGTLLLILAVYMIHNPREEEP